jgi:threonine/homoserine/homoserine lactone efflux protein
VLSYYFNFLVFAFVASITPGPSNLISLMIGSKRGAFAAIPFVIGSSFSAALILWLSGYGLVSLFTTFPLAQTIMIWTGALWISWLAWKLFQSTTQHTLSEPQKIVGWIEGVTLQLVNPKTWIMAITVNAIFTAPDAQNSTPLFYLAVIFFFVSTPCLLSWSWLGQAAKLIKSFARWERLINRSLAALLVITVWFSVFMMQ